MTAEEVRSQLLSTIDEGWGPFVEHFLALGEADRQVYLHDQGYQRLGDLLAHIIGWWELAIGDIHQLIAHPEEEPHWKYDVDSLNALAVRRFSSLTNDEVAHVFQRTRSDLRWLVLSLPEVFLDHPRIQKRLAIEITYHLKEHALP